MGAHRVNVNAICPGFVETDMIEELHEHAGIPGVQHKKVMEMVLGRVPLKRLPQPREVADLKIQGAMVRSLQRWVKREHSGEECPVSVVVGSPTWARTRDLRINNPPTHQAAAAPRCSESARATQRA